MALTERLPRVPRNRHEDPVTADMHPAVIATTKLATYIPRYFPTIIVRGSYDALREDVTAALVFLFLTNFEDIFVDDVRSSCFLVILEDDVGDLDDG